MVFNVLSYFSRMLATSLFFTRTSFSQGTRNILCCIVQSRSFASQIVESDSYFTSLQPEDIALQFKHQLAGRKYLPGSQGKGFPAFLASARKGLPYALKVDSTGQLSVEKWGQLCRDQLNKALPEYNAVLFRNLPLFEAKDFAKFASSLGYKPTAYEGGTGNRYLVEGETEVYFSTSDPPDFNIELHNEMACSPVHPKKVPNFKSNPIFQILLSNPIPKFYSLFVIMNHGIYVYSIVLCTRFVFFKMVHPYKENDWLYTEVQIPITRFLFQCRQ